MEVFKTTSALLGPEIGRIDSYKTKPSRGLCLVKYRLNMFIGILLAKPFVGNSLYKGKPMGFEAIVLKQYQDKVNRAFQQLEGLSRPPSEGWLKTVRQALGMTGSQLASRLGVTKGRISQAESAELKGGVTLKTMTSMAEAMNCRFIYAVIPDKEIEAVINDQAIKKAKARVKAASTQMALEAQALNRDKLDSEINRIASEIIDKMPSDFWADE